MKRFIVALAACAASVLFGLTAFANDATSPELSQQVANHVWLTLIAGFLPPVIKALNEGTLNIKTMPARFRLLLIGVLSAVATSIEMVVNGASVANAITAFAVAAGPSLLIEAVHAKWGGWKGAVVAETKSADGEPGPKVITVPPPPRHSVNPPPMVVVAILSLAVCYACGAVCPTIKLASDVCPLIMVELPDGTKEAVPSEELKPLVMAAKAKRLSAAARVTSDAGADQ
jgi:hypothetical protein